MDFYLHAHFLKEHNKTFGILMLIIVQLRDKHLGVMAQFGHVSVYLYYIKNRYSLRITANVIFGRYWTRTRQVLITTFIINHNRIYKQKTSPPSTKDACY